ncbi:hypothetical protein SZN_09451 [Streptomyces zinciresistens K42]|uniref:Uncharacterized protein n=1 Tax=Streptomyces zinciresistens K42 TaxID=700597 RepID=G2G8S2_9ACTN|nr:hypothetical protein [Streptomyces zinciresistens]EGX60137.1 hypothetical protein SZN_09451 [Streptomyces zinciresistens K42]
MPTIPHPTLGVTKCARCGAPVRWASGPDRGQRTPLNAQPSPAGNLAARATGLGGTVVRRLDAEEPEPVDALLEWKAIAHWNSCTGQQSPPPSSRPARRRPTVQPPLFGQQPQGRWAR